MEPITLCGAVIVTFGLWIEFEIPGKRVLRAVCNCKIVAGIMALSKTGSGTVCANRYVDSTTRSMKPYFS